LSLVDWNLVTAASHIANGAQLQDVSRPRADSGRGAS